MSDNRTVLARSNIRLYLDGRSSNFSYEAGSNRVSYTTRALSYAWHTVKIVAEDAAGNTVIKSWRFKVIA